MHRDVTDRFETIVDCKEVYEKHRCFEEGWTGAGATPVGRVVCCKECGKHWYTKDSYAYEGVIWVPVRWYHFKMRRVIVGKS